MKKIFIHAGPGKTGTSAIQRWMSKNRDLLLSQGIFYPSHDVDANGVSPGNYDAVVSQNSDGKLVFDTEKVEALKRSFYSSSAHTLVLSSEVFIDVAEDILHSLPDAALIVYFRNPLEVAESNYNQLVKRHGHAKKYQPNKHSASVAINRFTQLLEKFGSERVLVKPYVSTPRVGLNLVESFLATIGFRTADAIADDKINPSYTFDALEFKRLLNHYPLADLELAVDSVLQRYSSGAVEYSLMDAAQFEVQKVAAVESLEAFIKKYRLIELNGLFENIKASRALSFCGHQLQLTELNHVWQYIFMQNKELAKKLFHLVVLNADIDTGNAELFPVLDQFMSLKKASG